MIITIFLKASTILYHSDSTLLVVRDAFDEGTILELALVDRTASECVHELPLPVVLAPRKLAEIFNLVGSLRTVEDSISVRMTITVLSFVQRQVAVKADPNPILDSLGKKATKHHVVLPEQEAQTFLHIVGYLPHVGVTAKLVHNRITGGTKVRVGRHDILDGGV